MSHGSGESGRVNEKSSRHGDAKKRGGDEFAYEIARKAVAQVCESMGFQGFQQSALDTLGDVTVCYIRNLGSSSQCFANLAGRAEGNVLDVIQSLEEMGSLQGFIGASDVDHCLLRSGTVREIIQYVSEAEDIPFAYSIPNFPVVRERKLAASFLQVGEDPPGEHIPDWLPTLPDPQTYMQLPTENEGAGDSNRVKTELARQERKMDGSLLTLQQQFISNGSERLSCGILGDGADAKYSKDGNQFLSAPLLLGEKEVSHIIPAAKLSNEPVVRYPAEQEHVMDGHVSVLETFAPAIEAMKSGLCDSEEGYRNLNKKPVQFKIGVAKKAMGRALDLSYENKGVEKIGVWFGKDDEKDDKKLRAEKILRHAEKNTGELTQL